MTTLIANVVIPEVFNPYVIERTAELSAFQAAGIISSNPELDRLALTGGKLINMPFWEDLTGADEVLSDSAPLTPGAIDADTDVAALLMRGRAWGVNDLATALSGDDPMGAIANLVAAYWARRRQAVLLAILQGVFGHTSTGMDSNIHNISGADGDAAMFTGETFIDAAYKMGDAEERLVAIGIHSNTLASLRKQNLIEYELDSNNRPIPMYMGKRVIVDDGMPHTEGVFTSYLFGAGAFGLGNGAAPVPTETERSALAGEDYLVNRQHFILHPRGVAFQNAAVSGSSPSNTNLANAANWERVYEPKNVRLVAFIHKNIPGPMPDLGGDDDELPGDDDDSG